MQLKLSNAGGRLVAPLVAGQEVNTLRDNQTRGMWQPSLEPCGTAGLHNIDSLVLHAE